MKYWRYVLLVILLIAAAAMGWRFFSEQGEPEELSVSPGVLDVIEPMSPPEQAPQKNKPADSDSAAPQLVPQQQPETKSDPSEQRVTVPAAASLDVPFIVQAPNGNWDLPYKEACEEASVLMVHHFYQGAGDFSQNEMKTEIDSIIGWGSDTFGHFDTDAADTARYFTEKLGYDDERVHVVYDISIADLKAAVAKGIPVIVPAAGRELGNRFFQNPGPLYHMLVIIGYDKGEFIAHDPGTRRGEGYRYNEQILYNAIHDLTPDIEQIHTGRKAMILVTPAS